MRQGFRCQELLKLLTPSFLYIYYMYPLAINIIQEPQRKTRKILLEINAEKFERLAASFGLFNPDFIASLEKAENDYKHGRVKKIKSLRELRK